MRRTIAIGLAVALVGLLGPAPGAAQITDFDGDWDVLASYTVTLGDQGEGSGAVGQVTCNYQGPAQITGGSGPVDLDFTSSEPAGQTDTCEPVLNGTATIQQAGATSISGTIQGPANLGSATFTGEPMAMTQASAAAPSSVQNGTVRPDPQGPFANATGSFSATIMGPVPTLPPAAMGLLLFLLIAAGGWLLLRRRAAA